MNIIFFLILYCAISSRVRQPRIIENLVPKQIQRRSILHYILQVDPDAVINVDFLADELYNYWDVSHKNLPQNISRMDDNKVVLLRGDLYLQIRNWTDDCDETFAYALVYLWEKEGHPLAAMMNLCPAFYNLSEPARKHIIRHEFIHAMGFSSYGFERMPENVFGHRKLDGSILFKGPRTVDYIRKYYNCQEISGVWLDPENNHLSKRYFDELMTATYIEEIKMVPWSGLVVAMLTDSGWYQPRVIPEDSRFGWHAGCEFAKYDCKKWYDNLKEPTKNPFYCFGPSDKECLVLDYGVAAPVRYFDNPKFAGPQEVGYCGIKKDFWLHYKETATFVKPLEITETYLYKYLISWLPF